MRLLRCVVLVLVPVPVPVSVPVPTLVACDGLEGQSGKSGKVPTSKWRCSKIYQICLSVLNLNHYFEHVLKRRSQISVQTCIILVEQNRILKNSTTASKKAEEKAEEKAENPPQLYCL